MAKIVRENSFEGSPGGMGTMNYSTGWGTPGGGNVSQNPDKFGSRDLNKAPAHGENQDTGSALSKLPERPDRQSSSGSPIHPSAMSDKGNFENPNSVQDQDSDGMEKVPLNTSGEPSKKPNTVSDQPDEEPYPDGETGQKPSKGEPLGRSGNVSPGGKYQNAVADKPVDPNTGIDKNVDQLFKKKITPTPDEILSALQYEMNQMVKKDKYIAKSIVLKNLKNDPKYYTRLNMLNIDDDKMKVDESTTAKTKKVLDQMISERQKHRPVQNSQEINAIFEELWGKRHGTTNRKN